jgi:hypothetical protein
MLDPQHLTALKDSTACYGDDSFTLLIIPVILLYKFMLQFNKHLLFYPNCQYYISYNIYTVSDEESSIFWEVMLSVISSESVYRHACVPFLTVSELFDCMFLKL